MITEIYRELTQPEDAGKIEALKEQSELYKDLESWATWGLLTKTQEFINILELKQRELMKQAKNNPKDATLVLIEAATIDKVLNVMQNGKYES